MLSLVFATDTLRRPRGCSGVRRRLAFGLILGIAATAGLLLAVVPASQDESSQEESQETSPTGSAWRMPNLRIPVIPDAGGWEDVLTSGGFRIQYNDVLHLHRLLDRANVRIALGSRAYCEELLGDELLIPPEERSRTNIDFFTFGGLQYWGDEMVYYGWRIQKHARTGHFRLLDPKDIRRAWGTYEECERALNKLVDKTVVQPKSDEVVILMHGLLRARRSFTGMHEYLEAADYEVIAVKYPSTQASIPELATQLKHVIDRLEGARKIHFVAHSLGGLVIRAYLAENRDPRVGRFVMIATPNQGALMADMVADWFPYKIVTGPVGQELIGGSKSLIESLPAPWCEFAVVGGGRGDDSGYSPLIPGDDDGIVALSETRLVGMRDFMRVPAVHILLPNHERVKVATVNFLRTGSFRDASQAKSDAPNGPEQSLKKP